MKKLVWVAGLVLLLAFVFPDGLKLPEPAKPVDAVDVEVSPAIVKALAEATPEDKAHVAGTYDGMLRVISRDKGKRIKTTERWADFQANTLQLAIETPGQYSGLDVAIEEVFKTQLGTDDVLPTDEATQQKIIKACQIVSASARK